MYVALVARHFTRGIGRSETGDIPSFTVEKRAQVHCFGTGCGLSFCVCDAHAVVVLLLCIYLLLRTLNDALSFA